MEETLNPLAGPQLDLKTKIKAYLGFSRALVTVFVVAQAGLAAILALGDIPPVSTIVLGVLACAFGSMALIAYNDYLDVEIDKIKLAYQKSEQAFDIGAMLIQHPIARGILTKKQGLIWILSLAALSMLCTYFLDPTLPLILPIIALWVTLYCKLSRVTPLKTVAVSIAVTLGGIAGWLAVAEPDRGLFVVFALWTFLWEIGGRNIPNDLNDVDEDREVGIKTVPVVYGTKKAAVIIMMMLFPTWIVSFFLGLLAGLPAPLTGLILAVGFSQLLIPTMKLLKEQSLENSRALYNSSALYPGIILLILAGNILYKQYLA